MKLEELLGEDLFKQVQAKIDAANEGETDKLKHIRFADLSEGGYISKDRFDATESDLNSKKDELKKANDLIAQLKKETGSNKSLQDKIAEYQADIERLQAENAKLKIDSALQFALKDAGASDVDYMMFKAKEKSELELDDKGKIKGIDDLLADLKTRLPGQFTSKDGNAEGRKKLEPNGLPESTNQKTVTRDQFLKMGYEERLRLKKDSPEQYKKFIS